MHLQNMVEYLGPFPSRFLELCPNRTKYFNEDGQYYQLVFVHVLFSLLLIYCITHYKERFSLSQTSPPAASRKFFLVSAF
jgi:hypothetical protein